MNIIIAGGTGFIGTCLSRHLLEQGHSIIVLTRSPDKLGNPSNKHHRVLKWDNNPESAWSTHCEGADAVINLCGAPIADTRWTPERKLELIESRVEPARTLFKAIESWNSKPSVFISASGIGFYGDRGAERIDESAQQGTGFLPNLCQAWEEAAMEGTRLGLRVITIRIGMVLGREGGALKKMAFPFSMFLGGPILPGSQYVSWIHQDDLAHLINWLLTQKDIHGPINAVAPHSVIMKEFCSRLGHAMKRPSWFPVPEFILKFALGELASMLTTGQRVVPQRALEKQFLFKYPTVQTALHELFSRDSNTKDHKV